MTSAFPCDIICLFQMRQKEGSSYGSQRQIPECPAAKRDVFRRQARTAFRAADGCAGGLRFLCARRRHLFGGNLSQRHRLSAQGRSQGAAAQRRADDFASACGRRVRLRLPVFRRKLSGRDRRLQTVGCGLYFQNGRGAPDGAGRRLHHQLYPLSLTAHLLFEPAHRFVHRRFGGKPAGELSAALLRRLQDL